MPHTKRGGYNFARINAIKGGLLYGAGVFIAGFGFGILRNLFLAPVVNETLAILIEIPLILSVSWILCRRSIVKLQITEKIPDRAIMGSIALLVLVSAELLLWNLMFDGSPIEFVARYKNTPQQIGLAAQFIFASFPLIQR